MTRTESLVPFGYAILLNIAFLLALISILGAGYSWLWIMTIPLSSYIVVVNSKDHPGFSGTPKALNVILVCGVQVGATFFIGIAAALVLFLLAFL
ncbi:hypothetical protein [Aliamphritea ceti]|uniref:hypothetical protein n=1 Tax=Aliamphritea ceti TaxID=1524258 RepID=UPI0021C3AA93|nr:hypothetical protein [Aliamphritea ceti]